MLDQKFTKGKTVLVVEDFDDIREAMKILIELHGYDVVEATDGHQAVEMARKHRPDLILMDISMPAFDGIQATREIRRFGELAHIPIVAVTAHGQHYREQAIAAGCHDVVDKPVIIDNIASLIEKHIG